MLSETCAGPILSSLPSMPADTASVTCSKRDGSPGEVQRILSQICADFILSMRADSQPCMCSKRGQTAAQGRSRGSWCSYMQDMGVIPRNMRKSYSKQVAKHAS